MHDECGSDRQCAAPEKYPVFQSRCVAHGAVWKIHNKNLLRELWILIGFVGLNSGSRFIMRFEVVFNLVTIPEFLQLSRKAKYRGCKLGRFYFYGCWIFMCHVMYIGNDVRYLLCTLKLRRFKWLWYMQHVNAFLIIAFTALFYMHNILIKRIKNIEI